VSSSLRASRQPMVRQPMVRWPSTRRAGWSARLAGFLAAAGASAIRSGAHPHPFGPDRVTRRHPEPFLVHPLADTPEQAVANCSGARRSNGQSGTGGSAADRPPTPVPANPGARQPRCPPTPVPANPGARQPRCPPTPVPTRYTPQPLTSPESRPAAVRRSSMPLLDKTRSRTAKTGEGR
jgi:hypothetical protein